MSHPEAVKDSHSVNATNIRDLSSMSHLARKKIILFIFIFWQKSHQGVCKTINGLSEALGLNNSELKSLIIDIGK